MSNRLLVKIIFVPVACATLVLLDMYLPGLSHPLVWPVIAGLALVEVRRLSTKVTGALEGAARSTSAEIEQLRKEIERLNQPSEAKAAGFQIAAGRQRGGLRVLRPRAGQRRVIGTCMNAFLPVSCCRA